MCADAILLLRLTARSAVLVLVAVTLVAEMLVADMFVAVRLPTFRLPIMLSTRRLPRLQHAGGGRRRVTPTKPCGGHFG